MTLITSVTPLEATKLDKTRLKTVERKHFFYSRIPNLY